MGVTRTKLRSARAAAGLKRTDSGPTSKQQVSAATLFRSRHRKGEKKAMVPPAQRPPFATRSAAVKPVSSSSPGNAGRNGTVKQDGMHPLADAFNASTQAYRQALCDNTTKRLDVALSSFLKQLHELNFTTASSSPRTSDPDGSPRKITLADKADRIRAKLFRSIASYRVVRYVKNELGEEVPEERTLEEELGKFSVVYNRLYEDILELDRKWKIYVGEIWKVGKNCLGEVTMSALFLTQAESSASPDLVGQDLDLKPTRKRVTFQEPLPNQSSFLDAPTRYKNDIPIPPQISDQDIKSIERRIDALGSAQTQELEKIATEQKKWWTRKRKQFLAVIRDED